MTENDQDMRMRVRKILERWIKDRMTVDKVTHDIVSVAHRHTYQGIVQYIRHLQMKGIADSYNLIN
jgi:hypothetical protein